jgi:isopentenyl diphosphate isomerase/L-lactate dehydrogenase-like FMN-dependent dehydrogenase
MTTRTARRRFLQFLAASPLFSAEAPLITSPAQALNVRDFEAVARKNIPPPHFAYIATGVDDDRTVRANTEAFARLQLRPRRLIDVTRVDMSTTLFGTKWPTPIFICPCGSHKAFHPDGETAVARAGNSRHTLQILSTVATTSVEETTKAAGRPIWQQLYPTSKIEVGERIVRRAEAAGCPVLVITVDLVVGRKSETATRAIAEDSRNCAACHPRQTFSGRKPSFDGIDPSTLDIRSPYFNWASVRRLRSITKMKIVLKGIGTHEDARIAVEEGIDGLIVSNHGGRAEDSGRASIDCLPEVVDAVRGRMPVLVDGGVRRGTDILKAIALGATAVGVGRPYLWGLGAFGQPGVEAVLDILRTEFQVAMQQCGARSLSEITPAHVTRA